MINDKDQSTGMIFVVAYFAFLVTNGLVIFLANRFFSQQVVLGTAHITPAWAIIHSMGTLALVNTFAIPFARWYEKKKEKTLNPKEWMFFYLLLNFVGVWLVARFAKQFGLGISSWTVAAALAIALSIIQTVVMTQVEKLRPKLS